MSSFDTITCNNCGTDFTVHPSAEAADTGYCSPACQTESEGFA